MKKILPLIFLIIYSPAICFGSAWDVVIKPETELNKAAFTGNFDQVKQLINAGSNVNAKGNVLEKGDDNLTALMWAVIGNNSEIIQYLINAGADINASEINGYTALHISITDKIPYKAPYSRDFDIVFPNNEKKASTVKLLLSLGADVNARTKSMVTTALMHASGGTALMHASGRGYSDIVKLLIESGADVNIQDNRGYTALMSASYKGHREVAKLLIESGADVNAQDNDGVTVLMYASKAGLTEVVRLLIEKGADVDAKDNENWNALRWALSGRSRESLRSKYLYDDIIELLRYGDNK